MNWLYIQGFGASRFEIQGLGWQTQSSRYRTLPFVEYPGVFHGSLLPGLGLPTP